MALFDKISVLEDEKETKSRLKTALASKVNDKGTKFLYYEKFKLGSKDVPLVLVDYAPDLQAQVKAKFGKAPLALGHCRVNKDDELVFESDTGHVKLDALKSFLTSIGVARKVCLGEEAAASDGKAKTDEALPAKAAPAAHGELTKRLGTFAAQVKSLKPELRDSFEGQLAKVVELAKKDEPAALVLLGKLEEMLKKAQGPASPGLGELGAALTAAKKQVDEAFAGLPDKPPTVEADLKKSKPYERYAALVKSPSGIADAKALKVCVDELLAHVAVTAELARGWDKLKKDEDELLKAVLAAGLKEVGPANKPKLLGFSELPESKAAVALAKLPDAYLRPKEFKQAMAAAILAIKKLIGDITAWDEAVKKAKTAVDGAIDKLVDGIRDAVRKGLAASKEQSAFDAVVSEGASKLLAVRELQKPLLDVEKKLAELADIESRRARAATMLPELRLKREAFDDILKKSKVALDKTAAALDAVALSFRSAAMKLELDSDTATVTLGRDSGQAVLAKIDAALLALPKDPPPTTHDLDDAEKLLAEAPPDTLAARQRITKNLNALSPEGRAATITRLLDEAKTDPARMLSNNRAGNMAASLKALKLDEVEKKIKEAVEAQHTPKLKDWFTVLQLKNASGGSLKLGKVGDITREGKRIDLHMSLFLANLDKPPSISQPIDDIMNALLPPEVDHKGTHVTLELNGPISKGNPHYFHGATSGVPNDLYGKADWGTVEAEMGALLAKEMKRLRELVATHVSRKGKWPGE